MLHLEFMDKDYRGCSILIQPNHRSSIPDLKEIIDHKFMIENPDRTIDRMMRSRRYDSVPRSWIEWESQTADLLSELWDGQPSMNVLMLLSRAMQKIVDLNDEIMLRKNDGTGENDHFREVRPSDNLPDDWK
ncbi:MAG: hypothetical protein K6G22_07380 [Lachnospiraceae bacterium]|nr:hypothetical protein [Lachnospiraceae bacterium]